LPVVINFTKNEPPYFHLYWEYDKETKKLE
jgi:hypothetical protein